MRTPRFTPVLSIVAACVACATLGSCKPPRLPWAKTQQYQPTITRAALDHYFDDADACVPTAAVEASRQAVDVEDLAGIEY